MGLGSLHCGNRTFYKLNNDMLGVNSPREPITPEFSRKIREALWRATTGNLNPNEKDAIRRGREAAKKWKIVWETK